MFIKFFKIILFFVLLVSLCINQVPAQVKVKKKIMMALPAKSLTFIPMYLGKVKGIYKNEGVDTQIIVMKSRIAMNALVAREVDYIGSLGSANRAALAGAPIKIVMGVLIKPMFFFLSQPEIRSIKDLRGKVIGINDFGGTTDYGTRVILEKNGVKPEEVTYIELGDPVIMLSGLKAKSVSAGIVSIPFNLIGKKMGFNELAFLGDYLETPLAGLATSNAHLKENPDEVRKMILATLKSIRFVFDNQEEAVRIIMKEWALDENGAGQAYRTILDAITKDGRIKEKGLKLDMELALRRMGIKKDVPVSQVADFTLLEEILKSGQK